MEKKQELIGPRDEPDQNRYMSDPWYGYSTSRLKNSGIRGVPEYHHINQVPEPYRDFD